MEVYSLQIAACLEKSWKISIPEVRSYISQNDEKLWFFACWYKFIEIKSWLRNIRMGVVINWCAHCGCRNLKLALSHREINGINWVLVFWYKFRKNQNYFNNWTPVLQKVLQNHGCLSVLLFHVCPLHSSASSAFFSGMAHKCFLIFPTMTDNWNI